MRDLVIYRDTGGAMFSRNRQVVADVRPFPEVLPSGALRWITSDGEVGVVAAGAWITFRYLTEEETAKRLAEEAEKEAEKKK